MSKPSEKHFESIYSKLFAMRKYMRSIFLSLSLSLQSVLTFFQ